MGTSKSYQLYLEDLNRRTNTTEDQRNQLTSEAIDRTLAEWRRMGAKLKANVPELADFPPEKATKGRRKKKKKEEEKPQLVSVSPRHGYRVKPKTKKPKLAKSKKK